MAHSVTSAFGTVKREGHDASAFYNGRRYEGVVARADRRDGDAEAPPAATLLQANHIWRHDSRDMRHLPDGSVHLMITSPPYNVGKEYDDDLTIKEYRALLEGVFRETWRVLVEGGRACINIANIGRRPYIPLHAIIIDIMAEIGFSMRGEIIWNKGASAGSSCAWGSWRSASNPVLRDVHEYILVYCKGSYRRNPVLESSLDRDQFLEYTKSLWTFPAESARRVNHPAPFPVELPTRLIRLYSYEGDVVLDPFMGSGTTAMAALLLGRRYVGYELDDGYVAIANRRIEALQFPLFQ